METVPKWSDEQQWQWQYFLASKDQIQFCTCVLDPGQTHSRPKTVGMYIHACNCLGLVSLKRRLQAIFFSLCKNAFSHQPCICWQDLGSSKDTHMAEETSSAMGVINGAFHHPQNKDGACVPHLLWVLMCAGVAVNLKQCEHVHTWEIRGFCDWL